MKNALLHRLALVLAVLTLVLIGTGAYLTSAIRPLPGSPATAPMGTAPSLDQAHSILGYFVALLTLAVAFLSTRRSGGMAPALGLIVLAGGDMLTGTRAPVLHAILAPLFFAAVVVICIHTSITWDRGPQRVDNAWAPLRPLSVITSLFVVMQIGLGAAFRHNHMGVISHILNAMIVLLLVLVLGIAVVRQYPQHPSLHPAALTLLIVTGIQVLLGFGAYMMLLISQENNTGLIVTATLHVITAALTLAATVALTMQIHRNFAPVTDGSVSAR